MDTLRLFTAIFTLLSVIKPVETSFVRVAVRIPAELFANSVLIVVKPFHLSVRRVRTVTLVLISRCLETVSWKEVSFH